ncbi:MAG: hypothetical protein COU28_02745 [Candidatus Magasanikbacteria bacterium CG10_big_fil_rev_8_21_14_0_10_36_16]|uniref:Uncharacterized protein n=1 Tax=Candidatus Magasanikbacteria bacterium CG10_big_fil_rev_8_21_14_0_10_36_16 TaxID=1974645 RepID=A0A2H0TYC0_9BACT|nr:MAG: hypothetical protein COU28_02745 [Candidatus Magasanikbacteria bacterium CG10_big_fil_rev_8_21_14_0_10_36_16]
MNERHTPQKDADNFLGTGSGANEETKKIPSLMGPDELVKVINKSMDAKDGRLYDAMSGIREIRKEEVSKREGNTPPPIPKDFK